MMLWTAAGGGDACHGACLPVGVWWDLCLPRWPACLPSACLPGEGRACLPSAHSPTPRVRDYHHTRYYYGGQCAVMVCPALGTFLPPLEDTPWSNLLGDAQVGEGMQTLPIAHCPGTCGVGRTGRWWWQAFPARLPASPGSWDRGSWPRYPCCGPCQHTPCNSPHL